MPGCSECVRPRRMLVGLIAAAALSPAAAGGEPIIGPALRIDVGGGTAPANETTASASELDPTVLVGGWNDYRDNGFIRAGFSLSFDGGQSWADFLLRPPAPFQSGVEGDPMTAHDDRTGTLWAGAISFDSDGGLFVARLDPGETEFKPTVMASLGFVDKGWMAAGPQPGQPDSTRLYCAYDQGIIWSDTMGDTWTVPFSLGKGLGFLPRVGPDGEVYVAYWDWVAGDGVMLKRSLNGGATFTTHTIATRMDVWDAQDGSRFPGTFRVPPLTYLDVDPNDGTLYAVYFDTTNVVVGNSNVDLYFTQSQDQGTSWTTPVVINDDNLPPGDQFFPWLEVDDAGRIHIVFLDSRNTSQNDDDPNGFFDAYYTYSDDGGHSWNETRLTQSSWSSDGVNFIGDYSGMAVARNRMYPVYIVMDEGDQNIYANVIVFAGDPDLDGDGFVTVVDLLMLLAAWGSCPDPPAPCEADLDGDGTVGVGDLLILLEEWSS